MTSWWDQHIMPRLIGCACSQPPIMKHRAMVVPHASGDVLELGAGGGINAAFYDAAKVSSLTGIDPSPPLLDRANAAWAGGALRADIRAGVAEDLPFSNGQFDTVVTTFTLCSVCDPSQAGSFCFSNMAAHLTPGHSAGKGGLSRSGSAWRVAAISRARLPMPLAGRALHSPNAMVIILKRHRALSAGSNGEERFHREKNIVRADAGAPDLSNGGRTRL
jgi:2-polyprenyl-3-methyl-5-hydroxy-6-metoxy-1,4-benzoquinol methylase